MTMTAGADRLAHRRDRRLAVDHGPGDRLTDRQHEVLRRLALGHTWSRIADELGIARRTVQNHRQRAIDAYGGGCTYDLFRAIGWLSVPPQRSTTMTQRLRLVAWLEGHMNAVGFVLAVVTAALVYLAVMLAGGPSWAAIGFAIIWYGIDPRGHPFG